MREDNSFIDILRSEVVPALGCTEPIAVALAVSRAREALGATPDRVKVLVSPNIFKNGMGVGVPGTGLTGLPIAAALGMIYGKSEDGLEVLRGVTADVVKEAVTVISGGKVEIDIEKNSHKLYVEAICYGETDSVSRAIINTRHSNICKVELDGTVIESRSDNVSDTSSTGSDPVNGLSVSAIYDFAVSVPFEKISFILESAEVNRAVAEEGLNGEYGLMVGRRLKALVDRGVLGDDLINRAMMLTAAASDARMAGSSMPVISNSGSGNQGLTATLPVVAAAEKLQSDRESLARALTLSHLIAIHIKRYLGRLSALCGCVVSSAAAGCGVTLLLGGGKRETVYTIKNMIGSITGMICDGAKEGCALKISSGVGSAVQSSLLALEGVVVSSADGIIEEDIEKSIRNLGAVGSEGMVATDDLLLDIMVSKSADQ